MTIEVDNAEFISRGSVIGDGPDKGAKLVEVDVFGVSDGFELDDLFLEEFESRALVIGGATEWVVGYVVSGNSNEVC